MRPRRLRLLIGTAILLAAASVLFNLLPKRSSDVPLLDLGASTIETAPLCPWREPESDLQIFFPGANHYETETRILSGLRLELAQRLDRTPTAEENALRVYRIHGEERPFGNILTRRVKGEFGAIEIVLAVADDGVVRGVRLQRSREPDAISAALQNAEWLSAFRGKLAESDWRLGSGIPDVPPEARLSAQAVAEGVRSLLVLLDTARASNLRHVHVSR